MSNNKEPSKQAQHQIKAQDVINAQSATKAQDIALAQSSVVPMVNTMSATQIKDALNPRKPSRGRIVDYMLDNEDVLKINAWRTKEFVGVGNKYPMIIVRVEDSQGYVSGVLFLDPFEDGAQKTYCVEASQGDEPGDWQWPTY